MAVDKKQPFSYSQATKKGIPPCETSQTNHSTTPMPGDGRAAQQPTARERSVNLLPRPPVCGEKFTIIASSRRNSTLLRPTQSSLNRRHDANVPDKKIKELENELEQTRSDKQALEQQISTLRYELDDAKREIGMVKQELECNRLFGSRADAISDADIVRKVEALNNVIYQTAAVISDAVAIPSAEVLHGPLDEKTFSFFSGSLVKLVQDTRNRLTFASYVRTLQACITGFCAGMMLHDFFAIGNPNETRLFQEILNIMKASEPSAVTAHWRALAIRHGHGLRQERQRIAALLIHRLADLFGWPMEQFRSKHGDDILNIVDVTLDLLGIICRDYVSGDINVFSPRPGQAFDAAIMQLAEAMNGVETGKKRRIHCTTDLGVRRRVVLRRRCGDNWKDEEEIVTLLKAKVVMQPE
ncbi:hypothetical protein AX17_002445 [Amanita inopinata Kibby_2008]|nr:hypothetical protein AX17_002445 [Amanita inopinata Kibby_2008]